MKGGRQSISRNCLTVWVNVISVTRLQSLPDLRIWHSLHSTAVLSAELSLRPLEGLAEFSFCWLQLQHRARQHSISNPESALRMKNIMTFSCLNRSISRTSHPVDCFRGWVAGSKVCVRRRDCLAATSALWGALRPAAQCPRPAAVPAAVAWSLGASLDRQLDATLYFCARVLDGIVYAARSHELARQAARHLDLGASRLSPARRRPHLVFAHSWYFALVKRVRLAHHRSTAAAFHIHCASSSSHCRCRRSS